MTLRRSLNGTMNSRREHQAATSSAPVTGKSRPGIVPRHLLSPLSVAERDAFGSSFRRNAPAEEPRSRSKWLDPRNRGQTEDRAETAESYLRSHQGASSQQQRRRGPQQKVHPSNANDDEDDDDGLYVARAPFRHLVEDAAPSEGSRNRPNCPAAAAGRNDPAYLQIALKTARDEIYDLRHVMKQLKTENDALNQQVQSLTQEAQLLRIQKESLQKTCSSRRKKSAVRRQHTSRALVHALRHSVHGSSHVTGRRAHHGPASGDEGGRDFTFMELFSSCVPKPKDQTPSVSYSNDSNVAGEAERERRETVTTDLTSVAVPPPPRRNPGTKPGSDRRSSKNGRRAISASWHGAVASVSTASTGSSHPSSSSSNVHTKVLQSLDRVSKKKKQQQQHQHQQLKLFSKEGRTKSNRSSQDVVKNHTWHGDEGAAKRHNRRFERRSEIFSRNSLPTHGTPCSLEELAQPRYHAADHRSGPPPPLLSPLELEDSAHLEDLDAPGAASTTGSVSTTATAEDQAADLAPSSSSSDPASAPASAASSSRETIQQLIQRKSEEKIRFASTSKSKDDDASALEEPETRASLHRSNPRRRQYHSFTLGKDHDVKSCGTPSTVTSLVDFASSSRPCKSSAGSFYNSSYDSDDNEDESIFDHFAARQQTKHNLIDTPSLSLKVCQEEAGLE